MKQYFIVETSVFLEKNFYKIRFFQWKTPFCQKNTIFKTENEVFQYKRVLYISEIVFYSGNLNFPREKLLENTFFPGKHRFVRKIQFLKSKTRFSSIKEYFTSEIVFYSCNLSFSKENFQKIRFFQWKTTVFFRKNASFNIENEVFLYKRVLYCTSEIVFYSGNLGFPRENFYKISFFPVENNRFFSQKNASFNIENEVFLYKRVLYCKSEIVFYSVNLNFSREKLLENPFFPVENTVLSEKYNF